MSLPQKSKKKRNTDFWRACRFLGPYRRIVTISILCAFVTGGIMTAGLSALYPILQVLIKGDTLQGWTAREIAQKRLGIEFIDTPDRLIVAKVDPKGPAAGAGLQTGDQIGIESTVVEDPSQTDAIIHINSSATKKMSLLWMPYYEQAASNIVKRLPTNPVGAIAIMFLGVALLGLIGNFFRFFQEYLSDKAAINAVNDIRKKLYDHVLHIPLPFFGMKGTSDVTSRLVQDCGALQEGLKILLGQS